MITNNPRNDPAKSEEGSGVKSSSHEISDLELKLVEEMVSLAQSGENPQRLQGLVKTSKRLRVHRISELIKEDPTKTLAQIRRQRNMLLDITEPFRKALERADLTTNERIFLARFVERSAAILQKSLLAEKAMLVELYSKPSRGSLQRRRTDPS